jgi:hypothetical protein
MLGIFFDNEMEVTCSSETSVDFQRALRSACCLFLVGCFTLDLENGNSPRHVAEDDSGHHGEKLKSSDEHLI